VTTVKNTTLTLVPAGCTSSPRPKAACRANAYVGSGTGIDGSIAGTAWLVATRKPMTVPTFHDRWPLCSTT
jgi:hypothetical protein